MKRLLLPILITFAATVASAQTQGTMPPREAAYPETVSVTGTGRATLTPDRFTFTVGVQTIAPTVEEAVNQNNAKVAAAVAALKKAGATEKEIRTSNFSIFPQQDYSQQGQGQLPRILGAIGILVIGWMVAVLVRAAIRRLLGLARLNHRVADTTEQKLSLTTRFGARIPCTRRVSRAARIAILGVVIAMGLRATGIADDIVDLAFLLTFGAVAVAAALSFGLGDREAA